MWPIIESTGEGEMRMVKRYGRPVGIVLVLVLALTLSGCGNSKKGGSYLPSTHSARPSSGLVVSG